MSGITVLFLTWGATYRWAEPGGQQSNGSPKMSISCENTIYTARGIKGANGIKALTGVAQYLEGRPAKLGVSGSIPSQSTCLVCGPGPP